VNAVTLATKGIVSAKEGEEIIVYIPEPVENLNGIIEEVEIVGTIEEENIIGIIKPVELEGEIET
jgi:hypothetical protein